VKRKILSLVFMLILVFSVGLVAGCSTDGDNEAGVNATSANAGDQDEKKEVVIILKNLIDPFFTTMRDGAQAAADKYGINLTVLAPLQANNNQEQIQQVEQSIAKKVDAVVLVPADSSGIVPAAKQLNENNIPIINVNTRIAKDSDVKIETFVKADDYSAANATAKKLAEMIGGEGEVIILEGVTASQTSIDLTAGAVDAFNEFPGIKIVAQQSANFDRVTGMTVTQNLLQAHPNVKAIFAANDEMALGAVEAVDQAGKMDQILIAGINGSSGAIESIKAGKLALTCDKNPYMQGYMGVEAAAKLLMGETLEEETVIPIAMITAENVDQYEKQ